MYRTILIDDEKFALKALKHLLKKYEDIEVVGTYTDVDEAFEKMRISKVDIVFLDIEMPKMKGIHAADKISSIDPSIDIIFVTAYNDYAVDAFEINAIDYVMKPVLKRRLDKTIERIRNKHHITDKPDNESKPNKILCFRNFELFINNKIIKWRTSKSKELTAFLIYNKGEFVHRDKVIETLWPDKEYTQSIKLLHTSIYYIRKILKEAGTGDILIYSNEMYKLSTEELCCDICEFYKIEDMSDKITKHNIDSLEKMISLYRGEYFEENDYSWVVHERERLSHIYMNTLKKMADYYNKQGKYNKSLFYLRKITEKDSYNEEIHEMVLDTYLQKKDFKSFLEYYNQLVADFKKELDIELNNSIQKKYYKLNKSIKIDKYL
ncbi:response regulator [Vallitalea guaymasensis]|uniref:response regulator n=1 Tax=Vallitalea guaymasensis TaxID=1185412 RepID=UPI000DE569FA|nr:response regulator [Vallitalea guaymasensis]